MSLFKKKDKILEQYFEEVIDSHKEYIKLLRKYEKLGAGAQFSELPELLTKNEIRFTKARLGLEDYLLQKFITNPIAYATFDKDYHEYPKAKKTL